ncbi:MAG: galactokinase [Myxococcales bacterium]|nr:galactokinase [Myxococcales bacterium]
MLAGLAQEFKARFGRAPVFGARAPGRVNLIGEHTDYNEGLVLPCAIDRDTLAVVAPRTDARVRAFSRERGEEGSFEATDLRRAGDWLDYVRGAWFALCDAGFPVRGFDVAIASDVPPESGLSSSAALGLALVTAVDGCLELGLDAALRARLAHRGESGFVGVACGIMDPFASSLGRRDCALRIDCRSLEVRPVPLPGSRLRLLIAHSGVTRPLLGSGYGERREQCRRGLAAAVAAGVAPEGATALRDLGPERLPALERALDPLLFRRVRHVVSENERVEAVCAALAAGDLEAAGARLRDGMRSLREDFEVSTPELDALCEIADARPGVYGSRLTGAGFGGCSVHLVAAGAAEEVARDIAAGFERRFGRRPPVHAAVAADGAAALPL